MLVDTGDNPLISNADREGQYDKFNTFRFKGSMCFKV